MNVVLFTGALCNALLGKVLKRIIGEMRPGHSRKSKTSYGMPSSHANSLFFFVSYLTTSAVMEDKTMLQVSLVFSCTCIYALAVCYHRVYISADHTILQICAGMVLGSTTGVCCRLFVVPFATLLFDA